MICSSFRISNKYAFEFSAFHLIRKFKDGISFIEATANLDLYEGDHNPKFTVMLLLLNFKIFEINIYSVNHCSDGGAR